ncbi:hypothetical protein RN001_000904 [Aquatica leii]|uniref:THAP-type domain-containing protein n=1 Tax=Aquatica leii TaxID=1421715 RepID=A0AAN7PFU9_9COLE|nr:hypothetical protein RN001_000904 [Aquatica leii]
MVKKCLICGSFFDRNLGVSFHRFPKDRPTKLKWIRICKVSEKSINSSSCVCSRHFKRDDFDTVYWPKKRLLANVVPARSILYEPPLPPVETNGIDTVSSPLPSYAIVDRFKQEIEETEESDQIFDTSSIKIEPRKQDIKIIEVFSEAVSISKPARRSVRQVIDDDIEIIEDIFEEPPKQDIKIIEVFSEAPPIFSSGPECDEDIQIIEDSPELSTTLNSGSALYTHKSQNIENEKLFKVNCVADSPLNQLQYIRNLTVEHFATPRKAKRNLEFTKIAASTLNNKLNQFRVENRRLLKKIERFKNVLLYLRHNNLILEENAQIMVNQLL